MKRALSAQAVVVLALMGCGGGGGESPATPPTDRAVAYQGDNAHTGVSSMASASFPTAAAWTRTFAGNVSYPVIADGKVFVVEQTDFTIGASAKLHAFDKNTGAVAWGPVSLPATVQFAALAYDAGNIFVSSSNGLLLSFDAATGQAGWSTKLPNSYAGVTAPVASTGTVFVGDGGSSRIVAVDARTGVLRWSVFVTGGGASVPPSIVGDTVFVAYPCHHYALNASSGAERWHVASGCSGGGGVTVPVVAGKAYVRDFDAVVTHGPIIDIRDAASGVSTGRYAPTGLNMQFAPPAITASAAFLLEGPTLRRFDTALSVASWSFAGDGTLATAPLVVGSAVVIAGTSGMLYAVDAATGAQRWSSRLPSSVDSGSDIASAVISGLAAADGTLVVPAHNTLSAFNLVGP